MPSTPQVLPTVKVWDYVTDPTTGQPVPQGTPVTVTWKILQGSVTNPIVQAVPKSQTLYTDANGFWTMTVVPTDRLSPANSTYHVSDGYNSYDVNPVLAGYPGGDGWQALNIRVAPAPAVLAPVGQVVGNLQVNGTLGVTGAVTLSALTAGQVVFPGVAGLLSGSANLFWDNANSRLGIGTNAPTGPLHVKAPAATGFNVIFDSTTALQNLATLYQDAGASKWQVGKDAGNNFFIYDIVRANYALIVASNGNMTLMAGGGLTTLGGGTGTLAAGFWDARAAASPAVLGGTVDWGVVNNANALYNMRLTDAGALTVRAGLTTGNSVLINAGGLQIAAGGIFLQAAGANANDINLAIGTANFRVTDSVGASLFNVPQGTASAIFRNSVQIGGDAGSGVAANLTLTNTTGIGNGANTNMQSPVIGTGSGPASAVLVTKWLKIWDGVTARWIPSFT